MSDVRDMLADVREARVRLARNDVLTFHELLRGGWDPAHEVVADCMSKWQRLAINYNRDVNSMWKFLSTSWPLWRVLSNPRRRGVAIVTDNVPPVMCRLLDDHLSGSKGGASRCVFPGTWRKSPRSEMEIFLKAIPKRGPARTRASFSFAQIGAELPPGANALTDVVVCDGGMSAGCTRAWFEAEVLARVGRSKSALPRIIVWSFNGGKLADEFEGDGQWVRVR